ncbi:MAG: sulfur carrier protein ThiS [Kiritimatiellae bacterium]|nr:sulfur carrier protein ThiS [Kiritimatiellia bacterium]
MTIQLNGKQQVIAEGIQTVEALLESLGVKAKGIAVEVNGEILSLDQLGSAQLRENDQVEVIQFVGGG